MKTYYLIPLVFLSACSTTPKLTLRPQQPSTTDAAGVRYPEVLHAYHIGRYADPNDSLVLHEQHVVYRVEENTRWNFHPGVVGGNTAMPRDAAFAPAPLNDAILAEVNSQRLATAQIALQQTKTNLQETLILRAAVNDMKQRIDALGSAQGQPPPFSSSTTTNEPPDPLSP